MFIGLLVLAGISLFSLVVLYNNQFPFFTNIRLSLVESALLVSLLILLCTEVLSAGNALISMNVIVFWGCVAFGLTGMAFYGYKRWHKLLSCTYPCIASSDKILIILSVSLILLPLLFIAFYYPPNNGDSLWYHLPRIEHWIANGNVNHYRALCSNQLYHQPFAEFILLHTRLLSGSDFWFNVVQFLAMLFSLITVTLIVKLWGLHYRFQLLAALLTLSIPMGIMQATSTQTDYVAAFYCIAFIYFGLRLMVATDQHYVHAAFAAVALGFGLLTKMTVAVYGLPFGLLFALYYVGARRQDLLKLGILCVAIITLINAPFYIRNYCYTGTLIGSVAIGNMMINQTLTLPLFLSNVVRNSVVQFFLPSDFYLSKLLAIVKGLHAYVLQIGTEEQSITFGGEKFRVCYFMDENFIGSFILAFLIVAMLLYCCAHWRRLNAYNRLFLWYVLALCIGFFLFSAIFRWQPFHARLLLPLSVAFIPAITYYLHDLYTYGSTVSKRLFLIMFFLWLGLFGLPYSWNYNNVHKRVFVVLLLGTVGFFVLTWFMKRKKLLCAQPFVLSYFMIVCSLPFVFFNTVRPLLLNQPAILGSREDKYFIGLWSDEYRRQFKVGVAMVQELGISTVATDTPNEYVLWALLQNRFQHCEVVSYTHSPIPKVQKICKYKAILTQSDTAINRYKQDEVQLYKVLGPRTQHGNLKLIVLKQDETILV